MKKAHFVGIGGIGMSALAQMLKHDGVAVSGSDRSASPVTEMLEKQGIAVLMPQKAANVPADAEAVVYSDAVPSDNPERTRAKELGIPQFSYFQMLGKVSEGKRTIAVAGTHGKTTTTGMLAKILIDAGESPTAIVGSLMKDFGSNYVAGASDLFVVEACEYKDHLLELSPEMLVITNLEWDHTDYFPSLSALQESFRKAVAKVPAHGAIVTNPAHPNIAPPLMDAKARIIDYTKEPARKLL
ncbi:MAG TPA: Mur ligase domain-containing protein, partial [Candidatus Paceibacterota bacterium]|nr:Mur ligase domain-containing protein [Candidatus Paceibacterota bacterium]